MPQSYKMGYSRKGGLIAVADDLVISGIQAVKPCIGDTVEMFFQKAECLLVAASQYHNTVYVVVCDKAEGAGMMDVNGSEGVFEYVIVPERLLFNAAGQSGKEKV